MTVTQPRADVQAFLDEVAEVVARGGGEEAITAAVASSLERLVGVGPDVVAAEMRRPREDSYAMYPVHVAADGTFSVAAAVWGVGQRTPIHDHGTWGVIGILEGVERERRYAAPQPGAGPRFVEERLLVPGDVTVCCTSDQDVHAVACGSDVPTVALHVYGADIGALERHAFDPRTGEATTFVSRWCEPTP